MVSVQDAAIWEAAPATPGRARALVEQLLRRSGFAELVPTATLLTSEVVTNAVLHVGGTISVRVMCRPSGVRVEVEDTSEQVPVPGDPSRSSTSGRGLQLVEALATDWGATREGVGKIVWFELTAGAAPRASND
jgi:anti-sigma regulatory factor (Ser/Thr protein kinase)